MGNGRGKRGTRGVLKERSGDITLMMRERERLRERKWFYAYSITAHDLYKGMENL